MKSSSKTYVNTGKTDLSKLLGRIDDPHNVVKEHLKSSSEIKLDLSLSTSALCQKSALKLPNLAIAVSQGNELVSVMKTS